MPQKSLLESRFGRGMLHPISAGTVSDAMEPKVAIAACSISLVPVGLALIIAFCSDLHKYINR